MKRTRTKSVITMILVAVLCRTAVCPVMGAEAVEGVSTALEAAVEEDIEVTDVPEKAEELAEDDEEGEAEAEELPEGNALEQVENEGDVADYGEMDETASDGESAEDELEEVTVEPVIEELSSQEEGEEMTEITAPGKAEENRDAVSDGDTDISVAQAIWTSDNTTLTFYYGPLVAFGDTISDGVVTSVWAGTYVTDSGNGNPNWLKVIENTVTRVVFDESFKKVKPTSMANWFSYCSNLKEVDTRGLDTSNVTTMYCLFGGCNSLESVDVSHFDTSNVTDMRFMFIACEKLAKLDVKRFDTSKVRLMYGMFSGCSTLAVLDLSGFDVSKVEDMNRMFDYCYNLTTIYCKDENTDWSDKCKNVTMFWGCTKLVSTNDYGKIVYEDRKIYGDMAQSAYRGGYFTPKTSLKIEYMEVGVDGNVTLHWKNGGAGISGYKVRHRIEGTTEWRTTKVPDGNDSSVILKNLSPRDYEIEICSYTIKEGNEVESPYSAPAKCPVPKIEITNPKNGSMFADSFALNPIIEFDHLVENTGKGSLHVYDSDHNEVLSKKLEVDDESESQYLNLACIKGYKWSDSKASNPKALLKPDRFYHISIDEKAIQFLDEEGEPYQIPVYFSEIKETDDDVWRFKTVGLSYPGLINPEGLKINEQYYQLLFGKEWENAINAGDGVSGYCFGLSFAVGAYERNYSNLKDLTSGYSKLSDVPIGEDSKLLKYVQIAHLVQLYKTYECYKKNDRVYKLYEAVKNGKNVIIDLKTSGGAQHSVYSIGIIDDSDTSEIKMAVYDPNYPNIEASKAQNFHSFVGIVTLSEGSTHKNWTFSYKAGSLVYDITGYHELDQGYDSLIAETMNSYANDVSNASVTGISDITFSGNPIAPIPTVTVGSAALKLNTDYTVTYENNSGPGIASVIINGIGDYTGTITKTFMILPGKTTRGDMFNLANNVKVTWKEVPGAKYYKVYRSGVKDPVIVTSGLTGWDKSPGLENGKKYTYKIVASLTGKGDRSGDSPLSYSKVMYRLKTVVIRSVKNTAPGKVTVKYDKTTSGDSYVLQYCEREDMAGAKTKVVLGADSTSYTIGGLKKGKTYYISIRVRKKVDGIDYYTTFGVPKKVKVEK